VPTTRVKLAVTSPSRHFRDLAKKPPTQKRADKIKKHIMVKSYYKQLRRIISNNFQADSKPFGKFFRISNSLQQQRFSHKLKSSAKIFKRTSLADIISYQIKPFSSSTLFIKVIKIIQKHDRL